MPGLFVQTHTRPDLHGRTPAEIVMSQHALTRNDAMAALARYELAPAGSRPFETLWRPAGPPADPAPGTVRRDAAPPGRTDRQPRLGQRRSSPEGAGVLFGHRPGRHLRPRVRRRLRPLPDLHLIRPRPRVVHPHIASGPFRCRLRAGVSTAPVLPGDDPVALSATPGLHDRITNRTPENAAPPSRRRAKATHPSVGRAQRDVPHRPGTLGSTITCTLLKRTAARRAMSQYFRSANASSGILRQASLKSSCAQRSRSPP